MFPPVKFDDKHPNAAPYDVPEPGILKGKFKKPCTACGVTTPWMDLDLGVTVCSERCLLMKMVEYARASDPALHCLLSVALSRPTTKT